MKLGRIYYPIIWFIIRKTFFIWQKLGFHITPNNYYSPIPDTRKLTNNAWDKESELNGIELNVEKQLNFIDKICSKYKGEYDCFGLQQPSENCPYFVYNGYFGEIDGDVLYSMIRHYKPKRIIEIGCGMSTYMFAFALNKNKIESGISSELTTIDPFPNPSFKKRISNISKLIEKQVQDIDSSYFSQLEENDILFIDSSHVAKINSDVCYEYLEILPKLKKGVLIHIHDIFIPKEYPMEWVINLQRFWNESYLLHAFMMFNHSFEVIWASNYMRLKYPEKCKNIFRGQKGHSFWIKKTN